MDAMNVCLVFTFLLMVALIFLALLLFVIRRLVLNPQHEQLITDPNQVSFHLTFDDVPVAVRILVIPRDGFRRDSYAEIRVPWPEPDFRCEIYPTDDPTQSRQFVSDRDACLGFEFARPRR